MTYSSIPGICGIGVFGEFKASPQFDKYFAACVSLPKIWAKPFCARPVTGNQFKRSSEIFDCIIKLFIGPGKGTEQHFHIRPLRMQFFKIEQNRLCAVDFSIMQKLTGHPEFRYYYCRQSYSSKPQITPCSSCGHNHCPENSGQDSFHVSHFRPSSNRSIASLTRLRSTNTRPHIKQHTNIERRTDQ